MHPFVHPTLASKDIRVRYLSGDVDTCEYDDESDLAGDDDDMTDKEKEAAAAKASMFLLITLVVFLLVPSVGIIFYKGISERFGGAQPAMVACWGSVLFAFPLMAFMPTYPLFIVGLLLMIGTGPAAVYTSRLWFGQAEESNAGMFASVWRENYGIGQMVGAIVFGLIFKAHLARGGMDGDLPGLPVLVLLLPACFAVASSKAVFDKYGHQDKTLVVSKLPRWWIDPKGVAAGGGGGKEKSTAETASSHELPRWWVDPKESSSRNNKKKSATSNKPARQVRRGDDTKLEAGRSHFRKLEATM
jgi:MFS family permease